MSTTFSVTAFKNQTINMLTGFTASATPMGYINFYNGTQAVDPSTTPTGTLEFASYSSAPGISAQMSSSGGGVSQLSVLRGPTTPASALTCSSITTARIYNTSGTAVIDTTATAAGGGGGVIIDSVNAVAGVGSTVQAFSFKLPLNNGGTMSMNATLVDRMVDLWTGAASVVPEMGKNTNGQCLLQLYSGSAPASADLVATGTLLASIPLGSTNIWATAAGGAAALSSFPSVTAVGTGTVGYARLVKSYGAFTFIIQGSAGTAATDFVVSTVSLTSGVTSVALNEATISI